ncbi:3301_t:CDS:2, partial [Dentiscutata erythropus]
MCEVLNQCIIDVDNNVQTLNNRKTDHDTLTTLENYVLFRIFLQNIENIKDFIENIFIQVTDSGISLKQLKNKYIINKQISEIIGEVDDSFKDIEETMKIFNFIILRDELKDNNTQEAYNGNITIIKHISYVKKDIWVQAALLNNSNGSMQTFKSSIELQIALDISIGLVFLNAVKFLHLDESRKLDIDVTGIEYVAPEALRR